MYIRERAETSREMLYRFYLGIVVLLAAILLMGGSWYGYTSTFDTGTVGLMSVNIAQGERPLFFYGQPYFGALEAYLAAVFISLFGFSEFVISLAPISFSLAWIVFTYLLFSRIHNRTAGLIAATVVAFPGYYIWWFSVSTHGGYPAILCIGTALLWLCLRVLQERVRRKMLYLHSIAIGILMALGIWVHPLTFTYIAVGGILLLLHLFRVGFRTDIIVALLIVGGLSLLGFFPFYVETGSFFGGVSQPVELTRAVIFKALAYLFAVNNYELIVWNFNHTFESSVARYLAIYSGLVILFLAFLLALFSLLPGKDRRIQLIPYLIPIAFCLFFLALYVQHHLAAVKAPRYAISFLCMLLAIIWSLAVAGQTKRWLKISSWMLFGIWILYQVTGTIIFIRGSHSYVRAEQEVAHNIVNTAQSKNIRSVVIVGDHMQALKGQILSMFAENKVAFVGADTERYDKNAQLSETDTGRGYLALGGNKSVLEDTLQELHVEYSVEQIGKYSLYSNLQPNLRFEMSAVPSDEIVVLQDESKDLVLATGDLLDRIQDNTPDVQRIAGRTLNLDTGKVRNLCGVWLFTFQNPFHTEWKRPGQFEVHVSQDGINYSQVFASLRDTGNGFFAGPSLYIGGPWGKLEAMFAPVAGRYVKIVFPNNPATPVTEFFLFETEGKRRQDTDQDIQNISGFIENEKLDFVLADRWVSARLRELFEESGKADIALPRFSTKYRNQPLRYFVMPEKGNGIVCDAAIADVCARILVREYGKSIIANRLDLKNYSIFSLADAQLDIDHTKENTALLWNGHVPLQTRDKDLTACWLNAYGLPIWRPVCSTVKGIYHDSWTNGKGQFLNLNYIINPNKDKELHIVTHGWRPGGDMAGLQMEVIANKRVNLQYREKEQNTFIYTLPADLEKLDRLEIRTTTFVPGGPDLRKLGLDIERIEIR